MHTDVVDVLGGEHVTSGADDIDSMVVFVACRTRLGRRKGRLPHVTAPTVRCCVQRVLEVELPRTRLVPDRQRPLLLAHDLPRDFVTLYTVLTLLGPVMTRLALLRCEGLRHRLRRRAMTLRTGQRQVGSVPTRPLVALRAVEPDVWIMGEQVRTTPGPVLVREECVQRYGPCGL